MVDAFHLHSATEEIEKWCAFRKKKCLLHHMKKNSLRVGIMLGNAWKGGWYTRPWSIENWILWHTRSCSIFLGSNRDGHHSPCLMIQKLKEGIWLLAVFSIHLPFLNNYIPALTPIPISRGSRQSGFLLFSGVSDFFFSMGNIYHLSWP